MVAKIMKSFTFSIKEKDNGCWDHVDMVPDKITLATSQC